MWRQLQGGYINMHSNWTLTIHISLLTLMFLPLLSLCFRLLLLSFVFLPSYSQSIFFIFCNTAQSNYKNPSIKILTGVQSLLLGIVLHIKTHIAAVLELYC